MHKITVKIASFSSKLDKQNVRKKIYIKQNLFFITNTFLNIFALLNKRNDQWIITSINEIKFLNNQGDCRTAQPDNESHRK